MARPNRSSESVTSTKLERLTSRESALVQYFRLCCPSHQDTLESTAELLSHIAIISAAPHIGNVVLLSDPLRKFI